jgi:hypothetical protein
MEFQCPPRTNFYRTIDQLIIVNHKMKQRTKGTYVASAWVMAMMSIVGLMVMWLTTITGAQPTPASFSSIQTVTPGKPDTLTELVGCVVADDGGANRFTLSDTKAGVTYRLSGTKLDVYTGHRVRIVGGLYPSPNIAAQAGAIDPTKAAIAATNANAPETRTVEFPKFQVTQVRQLKGSCAPSKPK